MSRRTGPLAEELEDPIVRKLSRHMPPLRTATMPTEGCLLVCALATVPVGAILYVQPLLIPPFLVLAIAFKAWQVVARVEESHRRTNLSAERRGESICTFARSFPRRSVDAWVVRAVYEELFRAVGSSFPPRSTDPLDLNLGICEAEDVDDLIVDVADRVGRSLDDPEKNPHDRRIETVGDVVRFLSAQPPSSAGLVIRPYLRGSS